MLRLYVILGSLSLLILLIGLVRGARAALWWGWPLGMLLFSTRLWFQPQGGLLISPQTVTIYCIFLATFIGGSLGPFPRLKRCGADLVAFLIPIGQLVSSYLNDNTALFAPLTTIGLCFGPYLLGRWYVRSWEDVGPAMRPLMLCFAALSVCIVIEMLTSWNIVGFTAGRLINMQRRGIFTRAVAGQGDPNFMGLALVTMLPWAFEAGYRARAGLGPKWWRFIPWMALAAVFGTQSRGSMLATLMVLWIYSYFRRPSWRVPLLGVAAVVILVVVFGTGMVRDLLLKVSGESEMVASESHRITINNQEYVYSGSDHRWMLFLIYARPMSQAGVFGYGQQILTPTAEAVEQAANFWSIDCHPIGLILGFGYVGAVLFYLLVVLPLPGLVRVALDRSNPFANLAAAVFATVVAFHFDLMTVALVRNSQPFWMFLAGLGVTVNQLGARAALEARWLARERQTLLRPPARPT